MKSLRVILSALILVASLSFQVNVAAADTNHMPWLTLLLLDDSEDTPAPPAPPVVTYPTYASTYEKQVSNYRAWYGKSSAWANWMIANKNRYEFVFAKAKAKPSTVTLAYRYESTPPTYTPAWSSEAAHMAEFKKVAADAYRGWNFNFVYNGNSNTAYAVIIGGIAVNWSRAEFGGDLMYLYYDTIFNHEFGHIMYLQHHYDANSSDLFMPPGETECIMNRNSYLYCSACRTALGIPLDNNSDTTTKAAINNFPSRSP